MKESCNSNKFLNMNESSFKFQSLWKWAITFIIPLIVYFAPFSLEPSHKLFVALTLWAVICWIVEVLPNEAVAMTLPILYIVFNLAPADVALGSYSAIPVWTTPGAMLLGTAMMVTGLGKRIAFWTLLKLKNYSILSLSIAITIMGMVIMFICPDNLARVAILAPIAISICQIFGYEAKSREATILMLVAFFAGATSGLGILTSAGQNIMVNAVYTEVTGTSIKWVDWAMHNFIPSIAWVVISIGSTLLVLKLAKNKTITNDYAEIREKIEEQYHNLGSFNAKELRIILFVVTIIAAYILQPIVGFPFAPDWVFVLIIPFLFMPGVGVLESKDFEKTNFTIIFFIAGAISIGIVASYSGFNQVVADYLTPMLQGSSFKLVSLVWIFGVIVNLFMTPLAALASLTELIINIAGNVGINALPLVYSLDYAMDIYIFPYEYVILLFAFSYGYMESRDVLKVLIVRSILGFFLLMFVAYPFWKLLGLI